MILGSYLGVHLGAWSNFHLGLMRGPPLPMPYPILWPDYDTLVQTVLRLAVGAVILIATRWVNLAVLMMDSAIEKLHTACLLSCAHRRAIAKPLTFLTACLVMGEKNPQKLKKQPNDIRNANKIRAELATKFFTYLCMGFNSMFVAPVVFQVSFIHIGLEALSS